MIFYVAAVTYLWSVAKMIIRNLDRVLVLWSLDFGVGVFQEFFAFAQQTGNCKEELDLSTGQLSEEFRWELVIAGAELGVL